MEEERLPIVSMVIVADKSRAPANFITLTKTYDDGSDADLWKDGFGFGLFNRSVRYIAVSRHIAETPPSGLEVLTDVAVISDKEAVPSSFVCLDFTVDTKERALKKKYLCARFTPRTDAIDAVTNLIVLARSRRPPKGYTLAGDIDGMAICFRVSIIPEGYGRLTHSQSTELQQFFTGASPKGMGIYPTIAPPLGTTAQNRHSTTDLDRLKQYNLTTGQKQRDSTEGAKGVDCVPFELNPLFAFSLSAKERVFFSFYANCPLIDLGYFVFPFANLPSVPDWHSLEAKYVYAFRLERELTSPRN
ncbi:hypothetical protein niasHT_007250 [Heterodera trifolii]|uniref:MABP domain-containing protein n=1 Tax=Heterodera trifolii TaxID=157864 RepID=A0ABD2LL41_9BILA